MNKKVKATKKDVSRKDEKIENKNSEKIKKE